MTNIRYPSITGRTPQEQLEQMKSYLYQLADQLNWALSLLEKQNSKEDRK